ncbi:MAG TPA: nuclear transport factor 2 family protein [Stenotrophomonas sp.]|jgi:ketosteroid isomerase-like protein
MLATSPVVAQDVSEETSARLPDVVLPPPLARVLRDYERAWRAGDSVALASLFAEDGFVLQSHQAPIRGRQAIQSGYEAGFKGKGGGPLQLRALAFATENTAGYIIGTYRYGQSGDVGKFTLTLRRAPGAPWQIFSDMDNLSAAQLRPSLTPGPADRAEAR